MLRQTRPRACTHSPWPLKPANGVEADIGHSFDDLIGALLKKPRHVDAQCFRGFHIQNEFEPRRQLNRQVRWLRTLQDLVYESGAAPVYVACIGAIRIRPPTSAN